MSVRFSEGKSTITPWGLPILSMAFALLVHAMWLVMPQPWISPVEPGKPVRLVAYSNLDSQVWSPTLFSLPSSLGFSGVMRQRTSSVVPPLKTPLKVTMPYDFQPRTYFKSHEITLPDPAEAFQSTSREIRGPSPVAVRESRWILRNVGGDIKIELTRQPPAVSSGKPVVMTGVLEFDAAGQVKSLIVDPELPPEPWRSEMLHSLRRARIPRGVGPVSIRFRFGYERGGVGA